MSTIYGPCRGCGAVIQLSSSDGPARMCPKCFRVLLTEEGKRVDPTSGKTFKPAPRVRESRVRLFKNPDHGFEAFWGWTISQAHRMPCSLHHLAYGNDMIVSYTQCQAAIAWLRKEGMWPAIPPLPIWMDEA